MSRPGVPEAEAAGPPEEAGPPDAVPAEDTEETPDRTVELEGRLLRALADLDNLRKRFDREVARERAGARARVAAEWLPIVDDLERALAATGADPPTIVEGVRAVRDHAVAVLERLGFPRFDDVGRPFDPVRHEAVSTVEGGGPPGTVVAAVRPGYGVEPEILRPAGVLVARAPG